MHFAKKVRLRADATPFYCFSSTHGVHALCLFTAILSTVRRGPVLPYLCVCMVLSVQGGVTMRIFTTHTHTFTSSRTRERRICCEERRSRHVCLCCLSPPRERERDKAAFAQKEKTPQPPCGCVYRPDDSQQGTVAASQ